MSINFFPHDQRINNHHSCSCKQWIVHTVCDHRYVQINWRHCIPCIRFKLATLAYKALHTGQPRYLAELLRLHEPVRTLRSSSSLLLSVPRCSLEFGSRAFRISAPNIWNSLPSNIRDSQSLPTFRRHLKTLFSVSLPYLLMTIPFPSVPWFFRDFGAL